MTNPEHKKMRDITLEDILKLKRQEKPTAEFWNRFERDLQQRTLQALVQCDPWYARLVQVLTHNFYAAVPVALAVVLGSIFLFYQQFQNPRFTQNRPDSSGFVVKSDQLNSANTFESTFSESGLSRSVISPSEKLESSIPTNAYFVMDILPSDEHQGKQFTRVLKPQTFSMDIQKQAVYLSEPVAGANAAQGHSVTLTSYDYF